MNNFPKRKLSRRSQSSNSDYFYEELMKYFRFLKSKIFPIKDKLFNEEWQCEKEDEKYVRLSLLIVEQVESILKGYVNY